jgi:tRNA:m4X modification enzyme
MAGQQAFQRLQVDLQHVCLTAVPALAQRHAVIVGKHVCGAATDWALRALRVLAPNGVAAPVAAASGAVHDDEPDAGEVTYTSESGADLVEPTRSKRAKHTLPASEHDHPESGRATVVIGAPFAWVDAIAIATCCHHRCEWRYYTGR